VLGELNFLLFLSLKCMKRREAFNWNFISVDSRTFWLVEKGGKKALTFWIEIYLNISTLLLIFKWVEKLWHSLLFGSYISNPSSLHCICFTKHWIFRQNAHNISPGLLLHHRFLSIYHNLIRLTSDYGSINKLWSST
jgi:hypothetical protein